MTISQKYQYQEATIKKANKYVLIFSPDTDLAGVLLLNLEDKYKIYRTDSLDIFEQTLNEITPHLVLIDFFTYSNGIERQLRIMKRISDLTRIIGLRGYATFASEMDESINNLTDKIFYKPVDVNLITQAIEDLLN